MEGEGEKPGLQAALQDAVDTSEPPAPAAEQSTLPLDLPDELLAIAAGIDRDKMAMTPRRRAGRPPGAKNRRTGAWSEFLLTRGSSPLMVLQDIYSLPVEELAQRLNCDRIDALKLQISCAKELAPYVHQKMPVAVEVDENRVVRLVLAEGGDFDAAAITDDSLSITAIEGDFETVEDQQVSSGDPAELDSKELDS